MYFKEKIEFSKVSIEFIQYCFVGGFAFIIDYSTLFVFTELFNFHFLISSLIGFLFGMLTNYILSTIWVFKNSKTDGLNSFIIFAFIGVIGLLITEVVMWFGVSILNLNYMLIKLFVTSIVLLWNFIARKIYVFNNLPQENSI